MPSYMYPELNSQPAAAAAASSPATKMKLAKLWGMKGNSRKGWGRDPIPGSPGAPFPFRHLIPAAESRILRKSRSFFRRPLNTLENYCYDPVCAHKGLGSDLRVFPLLSHHPPMGSWD